MCMHGNCVFNDKGGRERKKNIKTEIKEEEKRKRALTKIIYLHIHLMSLWAKSYVMKVFSVKYHLECVVL